MDIRAIVLPIMTSIKPISPKEFTQKVVKALFELYEYLSAVAVPLTIVVLGSGMLIFIASSFIKSGTGKKVGLAGMLVALGGLFMFWGIPTIVGVAQHISNTMK